jgi:hypothetical protein
MKILLFLAFALCAAQFSRAQWEPDVRLTENADSSLMYWGMVHSLAASGDTVHVVWYDKSDGNWEIYYMRSTDQGLSWEPATRLTNDPESSGGPSIAVCGSFVHVTWCDRKTGNPEIYYIRSTDGGTTWEEEKQLTDDPASSFGPDLSVSGANVYLVWVSSSYDTGIREVHYRNSTDGGITWQPDTWLSYNSYIAYNPSLASSGEDVLVVWNDRRDGHLEIYSKRSSDGGLDWEEDVRVTNNPGSSQLPSLAISGLFTHLVFCRYENQIYKLFYNQSVDGGLTWGEEKQITSTSSISANICVNGLFVGIVWEDQQNAFSEVYFKCSTDGGKNWSSDILLNDLSFGSYHPFMAVSGSVLHVAWYDFRWGNFEIFYKRGPTGGAFTAEFEASPASFCAGDLTQFTDRTSWNPTQWQWSFPGGTPSISTLQNPQVYYYLPGSYDVTLQASDNLSSDQVTKTAYITVNPDTLPRSGTPSGPAYVNLFNTAESEFSSSGCPGAEEYEWRLLPAEAGGVTGIDIMRARVTWNADFRGTAQLSLKGINDCGTGDWSDTLDIIVDYVQGLDEANQLISAAIFPNPSNGTFVLKLVSPRTQNLTLQVLNTMGQVIYEKACSVQPGISQELIHLPGISEGILFLRLENETMISVQKIIISK